jgi:hypothetical protein
LRGDLELGLIFALGQAPQVVQVVLGVHYFRQQGTHSFSVSWLVDEVLQGEDLLHQEGAFAIARVLRNDLVVGAQLRIACFDIDLVEIYIAQIYINVATNLDLLGNRWHLVDLASWLLQAQRSL